MTTTQVHRGRTFHVKHWSQKPCSSACGRLRDVGFDARCSACRTAYKAQHRATSPKRVKTVCSTCGDHPPRPGQPTCRRCHADWMRYNRKPYGLLTADQRRRANCRAYTNMLIRRGQLRRQPCEGHCGSPAGPTVRPRHEDYDDPRTVRWACDGCWRAIVAQRDQERVLHPLARGKHVQDHQHLNPWSRP